MLIAVEIFAAGQFGNSADVMFPPWSLHRIARQFELSNPFRRGQVILSRKTSIPWKKTRWRNLVTGELCFWLRKIIGSIVGSIGHNQEEGIWRGSTERRSSGKFSTASAMVSSSRCLVLSRFIYLFCFPSWHVATINDSLEKTAIWSWQLVLISLGPLFTCVAGQARNSEWWIANNALVEKMLWNPSQPTHYR